YREGDDILPVSQTADGTATYLVPAGQEVTDPAHDVPRDVANRAAWSLHYSINTGVSGVADSPSGPKTLADYYVSLTISDDSGHTQIYDMVNLGPGNTPFVLRGDTTHTAGFADEDGSSPYISQNGINIGFDFLKTLFPNTLGNHFTVTLTATDVTTGL